MNRSLGIGYFVHPIPLFAVLVLAVNDHILKAAYPSFVTGKLSDLAGVFVFPIFLCALWNLCLNLVSMARASGQFHWIALRQAAIAIVLTDLIFASVKLMPEVTSFYVHLLAKIGFPSRVTPDATDLIAIVMNIFTWLYVRQQVRRNPQYESK